MYAGDIKILRQVFNLYDVEYFHWCFFALFIVPKNRPSLHLFKCKVIIFHCKYMSIVNDYKLNSARFYSITDLSILSNVKIDFSAHFHRIISKSYFMLGFMKRICVKFDDPYCLRMIWCSIVISILEYVSVVWNPNYDVSLTNNYNLQTSWIWNTYQFLTF